MHSSSRERALGAPALALKCEAHASYEVRFCEGLLAPGGPLVEVLGHRTALVVTTPSVDRLYGPALRQALRGTRTVATLVLPAREETKSMALVEAVCSEALAHGLDRRSVLVAVGGGVCSDIVTVAASLVRRGIAHVRVPTTLVGQLDASIGLKGAVNLQGKKSFLGCFHPPERVLVDPSFLRSVPRRYIAAGLAEALKMGIVADPELFWLIERHGRDLVESGFEHVGGAGVEVLQRSVAAMLAQLQGNPYEDRGFERLVDFGHTFSPALEAATNFALPHGEAVAIDMSVSSGIAWARGLLDRTALDRIRDVLRSVSLPTCSSALDLRLCRDALAEAVRHRGGSVNLVVPHGIGRAVFLRRREEVPDCLIEQGLSGTVAEEAFA